MKWGPMSGISKDPKLSAREAYALGTLSEEER
jgi:hypothetical protein